MKHPIFAVAAGATSITGGVVSFCAHATPVLAFCSALLGMTVSLLALCSYLKKK